MPRDRRPASRLAQQSDTQRIGVALPSPSRPGGALGSETMAIPASRDLADVRCCVASSGQSAQQWPATILPTYRLDYHLGQMLKRMRLGSPVSSAWTSGQAELMPFDRRSIASTGQGRHGEPNTPPWRFTRRAFASSQGALTAFRTDQRHGLVRSVGPAIAQFVEDAPADLICGGISQCVAAPRYRAWRCGREFHAARRRQPTIALRSLGDRP